MLVAFADFVAEHSKSGQIIRIQQKNNAGAYVGVLFFSPYYAVVRIGERAQAVDIFTCNGCLIKSCLFPAIYKIEDIVFDACPYPKKDAVDFIILAIKQRCYPRLFKFKIESLRLAPPA